MESAPDRSTKACIIDLVCWTAWIAILVLLICMIAVKELRDGFVNATTDYPYLMGMIKVGVLGTCGELLGNRLAKGTWYKTHLYQRIIIWSIIGLGMTLAFPLYSDGAVGLIKGNYIPDSSKYGVALQKSIIINSLFAPSMMLFHRVADVLIDENRFWSVWPLAQVLQKMDWNSMVKVAWFSCIWFWIPAHSGTFMLDPEYRILSAAFLAIVLGVIMALSKKLSCCGKESSTGRPSPSATQLIQLPASQSPDLLPSTSSFASPPSPPTTRILFVI
eukprot:TRINITY_DN2235_c0_g1_i1.p1 TRINITY_DN2235_c0_g1~~TRINITY_DN2235_c0_g1_i1.p1  ORF type:complete len:275 (+),score=35.80 TRINITY_DN2235_c0_g1_i1:109-933(+)